MRASFSLAACMSVLVAGTATSGGDGEPGQKRPKQLVGNVIDQEVVKLSKGPAPRFFTVTAVGNESLVLTESRSTMDGFVVTSYKPVIKDIEAYDPKGKRLSAEDLLKRVKAGTMVLVAADEKHVDPAFLSILKDDAVVLVGVVVRGPVTLERK